MSGIDEAVDERTPPFVASLETMPPFGQRYISEELVVRIHTAARVAGCRADRAVQPPFKGDRRQAQVARAVARRQSVQAKGRVRVEAGVLRYELLQEAVVAAANLEDQVRPRYGGIRQRSYIHMRRCRRVVPRRAAARVQHAQRKALFSVAVEVASGQQVAGAEPMQMLIGFDDDVIAIVAERSGECFAAVAGSRQCTPRLAVQQVLYHRIDASASV